MRALSRLTGLVLSLLLAASAVAVGRAESRAVSESAIKAAFLYNFAVFVEWPPKALTGATFVIGIVGDDQLADALAQATQGKLVNRLRVDVRRLSPLDDPRTCQLVYVSDRGDRQAALLRRARSAPVLTVGDAATFLRDGGIVRLLFAGDRLRFQLDADSAGESGLRLSAQLRALAVPRDDQ